jgi:hypothetical protein
LEKRRPQAKITSRGIKNSIVDPILISFASEEERIRNRPEMLVRRSLPAQKLISSDDNEKNMDMADVVVDETEKLQSGADRQ